MYAALWRKLPGPAPVKWLLTLILFTGLFFLLGGYFPVGVVLDAVQRSGGVAAGRKGGAVAKLGGEQRRLSFSFPDGRCVWAFSGRLEDPVDDHRVRVRLSVGEHRALPLPQ